MSDKIKAADAGDRVKEAADRIKRMREASNDHDGGYPATDEGRRQSLSDHAAVAEWAIFHSGLDWEPPEREPDTSLAASIERMESITSHGMACSEIANEPHVCAICDRIRIVEAARKVPELERTIGEMEQIQPEPDTSLAASIQALTNANENAFFAGTVLQGGMQADEAIDRIIEAARKWDIHEWVQMNVKEANAVREPQTFAEHVAEINETGLGYHGPKEKT